MSETIAEARRRITAGWTFDQCQKLDMLALYCAHNILTYLDKLKIDSTKFDLDTWLSILDQGKNINSDCCG